LCGKTPKRTRQGDFMSFVTKFQAESMSPVLFTMNKDLLKLIPKIASHPFYSDDANWFRVSFVFKHTQSRKRFVPSFLNFSATKRLKVRNGMNGGDEYTLKKIIISKSDRSHFVILESEIPDVANFNFALLGEGVQPDITSPIMTSITGPAAGEYSAGDALNFYLNFDEPVFVTGQPRLYLDIDFVYKEAGYISGSGSSSLLFRYIVGSSDNDSEGIQIDSFNLNGGTIKDASDNNASINVGSQSLNLITIQNDLTAPVISNITSSSPALLVTGDILNVSVNFSEAVIVSGAPTLMLDLGGVSRIADYSNTDGSSVIFNYTVGPADTAQYSVMVNEISLNGGTIQDASGNNAGIIFSPVTINSQVNPDVVAPALEDIIILNNSESPFFTNDVIQFVAEFSESVNYTGSPRLVLSINSQTKYANIVSSSGSNLLFEYTVTSQDIGDVTINSLDLNSGTIKDDVENNATLLFDAITGSISINPDIVSPTVLSVTGVEGDYFTGDSINFTVQFSENIQITNSGSVKLSLSLDSGTVLASLSSVSGSTATFSYTVTSADQEATSLTIPSISLGVNGSIADLAGNAANLSFSPVSKAIVINAVEIFAFGSGPVGFEGFNDTTNVIAKDSNGKYIVAGGHFTKYRNNLEKAVRIARLNTDASLDTTFNSAFNWSSASGFDGQINGIVVQSDGKIVVVGDFERYNATYVRNIVRLNADGSLDTDFKNAMGTDPFPGGSSLKTIIIDHQGKLVIGGSFYSYNGSVGRKNFIRLNSDGSLDVTFNSSYISSNPAAASFNGPVFAIIQDPDDLSYIVAGQFQRYNQTNSTLPSFVKINYNGSRHDLNNVSASHWPNAPITSIQRIAPGRYVFGGGFTTYAFQTVGGIMCFDYNIFTKVFVRNTTLFGTGFNGFTTDIKQQTDGKLVIIGSFNAYKGVSVGSNIIRLNSNGSVDSTFATGQGLSGEGIGTKILLDNNKIVVVGQFTSYKNVVSKRIVRIQSNGNLDGI
jgi:uncharacterized delta-60 repeat protein